MQSGHAPYCDEPAERRFVPFLRPLLVALAALVGLALVPSPARRAGDDGEQPAPLELVTAREGERST